MLSAGLAEKDERMVTAFAGVYLLQLDLDDWGYRDLPEFGDVPVIPVFFRLGIDGHPTGDKIDGGAWGPDTYENIARVMGAWFLEP